MIELIKVAFVYGLVLGSLYLLISLGFTIVCGVLRVFHLGYGVIFIITVYVTYMLMETFHLHIVLAIIGMLIIQIVFTLVVVYYPIVKRYIEQEELLLTALVLVFLIVEQTANFFYPVTAGVSIPTKIMGGALIIGMAAIPYQLIFAAVVAIITTLILVLFLMKTKIGLIIRSVSQDIESAELMGADVWKIYALAMVISVLPPTLCMLVIAPVWAIEPSLGLPLMITAILVAILGGLGNIRGSIIASYILGFIASFTAFFINTKLMSLSTLIIVLIVLIVRPQGIAKSETIW